MIKSLKILHFIKSLSIMAFLILLIALFTSSVDTKEQNNTSLLTIVKAYADAMIEDGRDVYGMEHSPLFAAALDRAAMKLGSAEDFGSIEGVRDNDRSLRGANPQEDMALYAILYELTELTGDKKYAREADKALEFFFNRAQSPETGLMAWGEHMYWDLDKESFGGRDIHEMNGEWPFWNQSYKLTPEVSWQFAIGLWDHQIADKVTGDFSRHARWSVHGPETGHEFPRYAGQMILTWADAYVREENADRGRRTDLIEAISVIVGRMEDNMALTDSGYLPAGRSDQGDHSSVTWLPNTRELARTLWKAKLLLDESHDDLKARMENLALEQDSGFHKAPHQIKTGGGFAATLDSNTGEPRYRDMNNPYTAVWATAYGQRTHAQDANLSYERYQQLLPTHPELAEKYRVLIVAAAEQYLSETPDLTQLQKPDAIAGVLELMINAYSLTQEEKFIVRAEYFSQIGIDLFLDDGQPLPNASNQHSHYEAITGGADFMHALLKLYSIVNHDDIQR